MSNPFKEHVNHDFQRVKETGGTHASRIREIIKTAIADAFAEVKEGTGEIRTIAHDSFSRVVNDLGTPAPRSAPETTVTTVTPEGTVETIPVTASETAIPEAVIPETVIPEAAIPETVASGTTSADLRTLMARLFAAIRLRVLAQFEKERTDLQTQFVGVRDQLNQIDAKLAARYGDRYHIARQRLDRLAAEYSDAAVKAEAEGITTLEAKQAELETKTGELGASAARKEQQIRQQVKQFLRDTINKR